MCFFMRLLYLVAVAGFTLPRYSAAHTSSQEPTVILAGARVNSRRGGLELLGDLLLRLAGDAPLHLPSGAWVSSYCVPRLPVGILLPTAGHGLFTNGAASGG